MNYSYYYNENSLCCTEIDCFFIFSPFEVPPVNIMNINFKSSAYLKEKNSIYQLLLFVLYNTHCTPQILLIIFSFYPKIGIKEKHYNGSFINHSYYHKKIHLYTKIDGFSSSFPFEVPPINIMNIHFKIKYISQ